MIEKLKQILNKIYKGYHQEKVGTFFIRVILTMQTCYFVIGVLLSKYIFEFIPVNRTAVKVLLYLTLLYLIYGILLTFLESTLKKIVGKCRIDSKFVVTKVEDINESVLVYIFSVYVPYLSIIGDIDRHIFLVLTITIFILTYKANLYYQNPILYLAGYNVYKITTKASKTYIAVANKSVVVKEGTLNYAKIGKNIIYIIKNGAIKDD